MKRIFRVLQLVAITVLVTSFFSVAPVSASSFQAKPLHPVICGTLGDSVAQEMPYGYTDESTYWYISGLWSWTSAGGFTWQGWSDWYYLNPADAGEFIQTGSWHHYPDGALHTSTSWTLPSGDRWYITINYLYSVTSGSYLTPWYSNWVNC